VYTKYCALVHQYNISQQTQQVTNDWYTVQYKESTDSEQIKIQKTENLRCRVGVWDLSFHPNEGHGLKGEKTVS
jgi:cell division protein FtsL